MSLEGDVRHATPCGRERLLVSMQGLSTSYGDGIVDQGAIRTASGLSGMVSKDRLCARATQSHTERNWVRKKE